MPERQFQDCCSVACAITYAPIRAVEIETKKARTDLKIFNQSNYKWQFKKTVAVAQQLGSLIGRIRVGECISCGTKKPVQYCGGHFKTKGGFPELATDLDNIFFQCNKNCNCSLSGNIHGTKTTRGFISGILKFYGKERLDYLERHHPAKNYSPQDLMDIRTDYYRQLKELKREHAL